MKNRKWWHFWKKNEKKIYHIPVSNNINQNEISNIINDYKEDIDWDGMNWDNNNFTQNNPDYNYYWFPNNNNNNNN